MTRPTSKIITPSNNKAALKAIKDERKKLTVQEATAAAGVKCATAAVTLLNKSIAKEIAALEKQRTAAVKAAQKALDIATKELERAASDAGKQFKAQLNAAQKELNSAIKVENKVKAATAKAAEKLDAKEQKLIGAAQMAAPTQPKVTPKKDAAVAQAKPKPKAKQEPVGTDTEDETEERAERADKTSKKADTSQFALF